MSLDFDLGPARVSKLARRLVLALLGLVLGLGATEIALAWVAGGDSLTSVYLQNAAGIATSVRYTVDRRGLRSRETWTGPPRAGRLRVLCVGASTTDQAMQSFPDTWTGQLESRLRAAGLDVEVGAYGKGGRPIGDRIGWLQRYLDEIQPDVLIMLEGINNMCWRGGPGYAYRGRPEVSPPDPSLVPTGPQLWRLYQRWRRARRQAADLRSGRAVRWDAANLQRRRQDLLSRPYLESVERVEDPIREFGDSLDRILHMAAERKVTPIVLGQPVLYHEGMTEQEKQSLWFPISLPQGLAHLSPVWMEREMHRYNRVAEDCARRADCRYVDLDVVVPKTLENYVDDCHYTDKGCQRIAEVLFPVVKEALQRRPARAVAP